jgi:hypothetical protein
VEDDEKAILSYLSKACHVLVNTFGNLQCPEDWIKLHHHLLQQMGKADADNKNEDKAPQTTEVIVTETIRQFQSLTPIRFSFLDGQCRMITSAHYIRKLLPTVVGQKTKLEVLAQSTLKRNGFDDTFQWDLSNTGQAIITHIIMPQPHPKHGMLTRECATGLVKISMERGNSLDMVTKANLSDAIRNVIWRAQFADAFDDLQAVYSFVDKQQSFVVAQLIDLDSSLAFKVNTKLSKTPKAASKNDKASPLTLTERAEMKLKERGGQNKRFPIFNTGTLENPLSELLVISKVMGCFLADRECAALLKDCISKNWTVPFLPDQEVFNGIKASELAKGTYAGDGARWYETELFMVSEFVLVYNGLETHSLT